MRPIDRINYLNIGLMIFSCVVAYAFPFELFLFSYAVLGPLHYLTEISWLHERHYFTEPQQSTRAKAKAKTVGHSNRAWLSVVAVTMVLLLFGYGAAELLRTPLNPKWEITMFYVVMVTALLVTQPKNKTITVVVLLVALAAFALFSSSRYYLVLALFLITIVHVFIFTGAFILQGALKGRSASGVWSLLVFIACAAIFFIYVPETHGTMTGSYVRSSYSSFNALNAELIKLLGFGPGSSAAEVYESTAGLMIMRLIAFAYTYHYLNWFSKTSIIKWHEVSRSRIAIIAAAWLVSMALYAYNYETGMTVLYFLSILHVMLEFPLNHRTFAGIGRELFAIVK